MLGFVVLVGAGAADPAAAWLAAAATGRAPSRWRIAADNQARIGSIAFMSYAATLFGFGAWAWLLSRYPASQVAPFALFVPVAGIASGALLLGEGISGIEIAGSVLVFAGLLLNVFGPRLFKRAAA